MKNCEWENCPEPAKHHARWNREKANGRADVYDYADYCVAHMEIASQNGAVKVAEK